MNPQFFESCVQLSGKGVSYSINNGHYQNEVHASLWQQNSCGLLYSAGSRALPVVFFAMITIALIMIGQA